VVKHCRVRDRALIHSTVRELSHIGRIDVQSKEKARKIAKPYDEDLA